MIKNLAIITLIFLTACQPMPKSWNWGVGPRPITGVKGFPEADTDYGRGFKDGCRVSFATTSKGLIEGHDREVSPLLMTQSPDYNSGWWDGTEQCLYIMDHDTL